MIPRVLPIKPYIDCMSYSIYTNFRFVIVWWIFSIEVWVLQAGPELLGPGLPVANAVCFAVSRVSVTHDDCVKP